jgi:hypothetical protein
MYVVEVRPAKAWRGLRLLKRAGMVARPSAHRAATHWFAKSTAQQMLDTVKLRIGQTDKPLSELDVARKGIRECECAPVMFPPRRRRRR